MVVRESVAPAFSVELVLDQLCRAWAVDDLHDVVEIRYSDRLTHNFGHCVPAHARVTLARRLLQFRDVLEEVLVHEVAHFEAWRRDPAHAPHHGEPWKSLMRAAGFEPRRSLPPLPGDPPSRVPGYYLHHCPVCSAQRVARRPVQRWRCVACHRAGRDGLLRITRLDR